MKKSLLAAAVVVAIGAVGGAAFAQVKPDVLVKQRQSAMTLINLIGTLLWQPGTGFFTEEQGNVAAQQPLVRLDDE